ncbi:MAG: hypothetical protein ACJ786_21775 [Catenulispora sp.]|jgi:hypothetical protein
MILSEALNKFDTGVLEHLDRDAAVPHVTTAGIQGDVSFLLDQFIVEATTVVPAAGVAVVRGENGGNTHLLLGDGPVMFDRAPVDDDPETTVIGTLTVPEGSTAVLAHPEHGYMSFGVGTWRVGRQREQADVVAFVED